MSYLRRLIHRCAIKRPTVARSETGTRKATYAVVTGSESVPCLLVERDAARVQAEFGAQVKCDAIVLFPRGTEIRPNARVADGKNDKLVITDEQGRVSEWLVESSKDSASARSMVVAAVNRAAR